MIEKSSYLISAIATILALYRFMVILFFDGAANLILVFNHLAIMGVFAFMAGMFFVYGRYRSNKSKKILVTLKEHKIMKTLSFITGIFCVLRFCSTILYFRQMESLNELTTFYVLIELLLWLVLAVFFFAFWNRKRKHIHRLGKS